MAAADEVLGAIAGRVEPFGAVGQRWMDRWRERQPSRR
jgi:hypothetical protein